MQLTVDDVVVPDLPKGRRVHVDRHGSLLVAHAVDARRGCGERPSCLVLAQLRRCADDERLAADSTLEHVDADARAAMVVEARVPGLGPVIEPGLRVLVAPEELERFVALPLEPVELDQLGGRPGELHALRGSQIVVTQRQGLEASAILHGSILPGCEASRSEGR